MYRYMNIILVYKLIESTTLLLFLDKSLIFFLSSVGLKYNITNGYSESAQIRCTPLIEYILPFKLFLTYISRSFVDHPE